jgi:hypothetical protein
MCKKKKNDFNTHEGVGALPIVPLTCCYTPDSEYEILDHTGRNVSELQLQELGKFFAAEKLLKRVWWNELVLGGKGLFLPQSAFLDQLHSKLVQLHS